MYNHIEKESSFIARTRVKWRYSIYCLGHMSWLYIGLTRMRYILNA